MLPDRRVTRHEHFWSNIGDFWLFLKTFAGEMCHFCLVTRQIVTFWPFGKNMSVYRADDDDDDGHPSGPFHLLDLDQMDILIVVGTKKENGRLNNIGVDGMEKEDIIIL